MSSPSGPRSIPPFLLVLLALAAAAAILAVAVPRLMASRAEAEARRSWASTMTVEALARPREPRAANAAALALEQSAAGLGFSLAPRGTTRAAIVPAPGEPPPLATLHSDLAGLLAGGSTSSIAPALARWLAATAGSLDALAVDVQGGEPPRWESTDEPMLTRSPASLERCDRLVLEAARLAALPPNTPLSSADEHLTRPGTPRLDGIVLLHETFLLAALVDGRSGDMPRALRFISACLRLEDGLGSDADLLTLGVLANLARLRLAVLRDLAPPLDAAPFLGPDLEARYRDAVLLEASAWARSLAPRADARTRGALEKAEDFMFSGPSRAMRASTLAHLQAIAASAGPVPVTDADLAALAARVASSAPGWDSPQRAYLFDIAALRARLRRVRLEAELTRRLLATRALMLTTGDAGVACREIASAPADELNATFSCGADASGQLALLATSSAPSVGRPAAFEPPLSAVLMPAR